MGTILPMESEAGISKYEGHTRHLPCNARLNIISRSLRKTERLHKHNRFPPEHFLAFYIQHYGSLTGNDSHIANRISKGPFQVSYALMPHMHFWLNGAPPSGSERNLSQSLRKNLRMGLFSLAKSIMEANRNV